MVNSELVTDTTEPVRYATDIDWSTVERPGKRSRRRAAAEPKKKMSAPLDAHIERLVEERPEPPPPPEGVDVVATPPNWFDPDLYPAQPGKIDRRLPPGAEEILVQPVPPEFSEIEIEPFPVVLTAGEDDHRLDPIVPDPDFVPIVPPVSKRRVRPLDETTSVTAKLLRRQKTAKRQADRPWGKAVPAAETDPTTNQQEQPE